jgi:hypothetical protein
MIRWQQCLIHFALVSTVAAQARLPLQGYYHPGRCMAVMVQMHDQPIDLLGEGIVPTHVEAGRAGIVPLLTLRTDASLNSASALHSLGFEERLVGTTISDHDIAAEIFPGKKIIVVDLQAPIALSGPAMAWGSLDALVLGEKIDPNRVGDLLSAGVCIAVLGNDPPDARWPWRRLGMFWILRGESAGPSTAIGGDAAYAPMQSWRATQSPTLRWRIVIVGIVVCLLMMSPLLLSGRWIIVAMLAMALIGAAAIESWRRSQPTLRSESGEIIVDGGDGVRQSDAWRYFLSTHGGSAQFTGAALPIVLDANHAARIHLQLQCDADGTDVWKFDLPAAGQLAFVRRRMSLGKIPANLERTNRSPLYELARQSYLDSSTRILGEIAATEDSWPTVVVGRK